MELPSVPQARRTQSEFRTLDQRLVPSERPEKIGLADIAVIQPVVSPSLKMVGGKFPTSERDGDAELIFFIALPVQRREREIFAVREVEQRSRSREQRGRLVEMAVESVENPIQLRNLH